MGTEKFDYEKMFMALSELFKNTIQTQEIYFRTLQEINELKPYNNLISKRICNLKMFEQIAILKHVLEIHKISKKLCEKYGWDEEIQTEEG